MSTAKTPPAERWEDVVHRQVRAGHGTWHVAFPELKRIADLVAAVREVIAWKSEDGHRELDQPTQAMADRLAALDEGAASA